MGKDSMSSERMELFWTFLDAFMFDKAQKCIASDFQCSALHPEKQTTLLANAIARGLTSLKPEQEKCFELIKALRHCGASWTQACQSSSTQSIWKNADPEKSKITLEYGTHSALSFARAWLRELHDKKEWEYNASFLHKVFEIFLAEPQPSRNKLAIDEGIVDLWENLLLATDSHDLTIDTAGGPVTAHAQMLKAASPVVRAMLESSMKERRTQRIQLNDTPREAVSLLLEIVYTCSSQNEPDYKTVLAALDLAHRWQVQVVVRILGELLEQMITDESFASIAEHAALKGLEALKKACQKFGTESKVIQDQLKKDTLPKVVKEMFHQETAAAGAPRKKRKCDRMELFWAFMDIKNFDKARQCIDSDFRCDALHPKEGITLLVEAIGAGMCVTAAEEKQCLELIKALRVRGASWTQPCRSKSSYSVWKLSDPEKTKVSVLYGTHTALSFVQAWLHLLDENKKWDSEVSYLRKALEIFLVEPQPSRNKLAIDEGIVDLWEKLFLATDSHDLTIDTADGPVTAHAQMLKEASPVVRAMLESSMKERQTQRIQLNDTPREAVSLLLEILYTCSSQNEPDYKTVLFALDLAHRWQVQVVVRILGELLEQMITDESFASIAEHAVLKGLEALKKACQKFGAESKIIQDQLKKDTLPKVVKEMFHQETAAAGAPRKKRKAQNCLELIKALRSGGASWTQTCKEDAPEDTIAGPKSIEVTVDCGSLSALSYIQAWLCKFGTKKLWRDAVSFLHKVLDCYWVELESHPQRHKLAIDEDIVDLWEKLLLATDSHDLTIDAAEGPVTAHAQMLKEASPVVRAIGITAVGDLVYLLLPKTVLFALDLAHRWQVQVVVRILGELLEHMITDERFAAIAEHAALKGLETLKKACQKFGAESWVIQDQLKKDMLPKVVKEMFHQETAECHIFMDAADRSASVGSAAGKFYSNQPGLNRYPDSVQKERLLPLLQRSSFCEDLFGTSQLKDLKAFYSPGEPAVNRYIAGGAIAPHIDREQLTLNVVLSEPGAFHGGGTAFWPQKTVDSAPEESTPEVEDDVVILRPLQGTAIIFNGQVTHAGRAVTEGIRHAYAALAELVLASLKEGLSPRSFSEYVMLLLQVQTCQAQNALAAGEGAEEDSGEPHIFVLKQQMNFLIFASWLATAIWRFSSQERNRLAYLELSSEGSLMQLTHLLRLPGLAAEQVPHGLPASLQVFSKGELAEVSMESFIELPENYLDLLQEVRKRSCSKCQSAPDEPALCLLCGAIVCVGNQACRGGDQEAGEGPCTSHARTCTAGQSLFLLPYLAMILAVSAPDCCLWDCPYVDKNGEPNPRMKRPCAMNFRLDARRWENLRQIFVKSTVRREIFLYNEKMGQYIPEAL
eukprot:symbB.v1.2.008833.t1/scaffold556.1/size187764/4